MFAVNENYDVGVLLDCARFAQVAHLRTALVLLALARKLRQKQYGHAQLFRGELHHTRYLADVLLTVFGALSAAHKREIVDHDQVKPFLFAFEPSAFAQYIHRRGERGVVHEYLGHTQRRARVHYLAPLVRALYFAFAHLCEIHLSERAYHTFSQLRRGHFEREYGAYRGLFGLARLSVADMRGSHLAHDVHTYTRFTLSGTGGYDDKITRAQTAEQEIEIAETRSQSPFRFGIAVYRVEIRHRLVYSVFEGHERAYALLLRHVGNDLFRILKRFERIFGSITLFKDLVGCRH